MGEFLKDLKKELRWYPECGVGYYPVELKNWPYDAAYFAKYELMEETSVGKALIAARLDLVREHTFPHSVVDIGIGSGGFVKAAGCVGYDVNPAAQAWLLRSRRWCNPYQQKRLSSVCCWDSLEHIEDPSILLRRVMDYVFVSIPIFKNCDHVLRSKHFRKNEHYWYFTDEGLKTFMSYHGFGCMEQSAVEVSLGREDIGTYVFRRQT